MPSTEPDRQNVQIGLGLGSNIGDKPGNILRALALLDARGAVVVSAVSSIYRTSALGLPRPRGFRQRLRAGDDELRSGATACGSQSGGGRNGTQGRRTLGTPPHRHRYFVFWRQDLDGDRPRLAAQGSVQTALSFSCRSPRSPPHLRLGGREIGRSGGQRQRRASRNGQAPEASAAAPLLGGRFVAYFFHQNLASQSWSLLLKSAAGSGSAPSLTLLQQDLAKVKPDPEGIFG